MFVLVVEIGDSIGTVDYDYLNARQPSGDIIRTAIANYPASAGVGRKPWSVVAINMLAEPKNRYQFATIAGNNAIDASTGANVFTAGSGTQQYVTIPDPYLNFKQEMESLIAADVVQGTKVWNGTACI
jgi:hypothetical protein